MATLWASPVDSTRLADARSVALLVGGYDGSGNYGDVLQLAAAIETVRRVPGPPLPVAVVEGETLLHHRASLRHYPAQLSEAAFVHFHEGAEPPGEGLIELPPGLAKARSAVYMYGGGYLNERWGARKVAHAAAAEQLADGGPGLVVASGLQVEGSVVAPGGVAHSLLSRASWIGARDLRSLECMRAHLGGASSRIALSGDDATPLLRAAVTRPTSMIVNLHLNDGTWISDNPEATRGRIATLLGEVGQASEAPLSIQPVIAYEDPRVSERRAVSALLRQHGDDLHGWGLRPIPAVDVLRDATDHSFACFRRARLTIACSYHVTLTSLLAGIPALLLAENDYYDQKAAGLRHLFGLDCRLVGVRGASADAEAAAEVIVDGPARSALVGRLHAGSAELGHRHAQGREVVVSVLAECLRGQPGPRRRTAQRPATLHDGIEVMEEVHPSPLHRLLDRLRTRRSVERVPVATPEEALSEIAAVRSEAVDALARADYALEVARDVSLPARMLALMSWLELQPVQTGPTVSVILATRDRPRLLSRAIASVLAQRYQRWELIVIDDGTASETGAVIRAVDDERLLAVDGPRQGLGAARNAGLRRADGDIVCYLDDDGIMHPTWLQAVAHVLSGRSDIDVVYGVTLAEHRLPDDPDAQNWLPSLWQLPWSREVLRKENVTDAGAVAHRRELEEARFDETLSTGEDWDLLLRLTADRDALAVPAISHAYSMDDPDRMSRDPRHRAGLEKVRRRHAER